MPQMRYRFGAFELDPASRELWRGDERIALPPKSFECLAYLIAHRDRAVGRDELISAVWGRVETSDTVVAQTLLRARKALDDTGDRQATVRTVPRFGYRWVAPVEEVIGNGAATPASLPEPLPTVVSQAEPALPSKAQDAVATADPPALQAASRRSWPWLAAAMLAIAVAIGWAWHARQGIAPIAQSQRDVVLVLPVRVAPGDAESSWVRLGAMDYIASRVRRSGMKVLPSDQTLHLSAQVGDIVSSGVDAWQKLQAGSGAQWVLSPEARRDPRGWLVRLQWKDGVRDQQIEARGATALTAAAAATDSWLRRMGRRGAIDEAAPTALTERVQQIDAELTTGQLAAVRRLIDAAPPQQRAEPSLKVREGQLEYRSGRIDQAEKAFLALIDDKREPPSTDVRAKALMGLGAVEIRRQNFPAAESRYTQALAVLEANATGLDDPSLLGNAYNGRGVAQAEQKKMEAAVRDMGMARIAMQRAGDLVEAAMVGSNLGIIETKRGHYPQALQEFDRAIATYERFGVRDYLAATLTSKAMTQLQMAQPGAALATIERARVQFRTIEDAGLAINIGYAEAKAQLANGRLRDAQSSLERLKTLGVSEPFLREAWIRLRLAQGRQREAATLARMPAAAGDDVSGAAALAAVQAALRDGDIATARLWLAHAPAGTDGGNGEITAAWEVARALVDQGAGHRDSALAAIDRAAARAARQGSPEERVLAGVAHALLLLDSSQPQPAAAVLGGLDTFANSDYRVAWATLALYRALGDAAQIEQAQAQAQALRGERDLAIRPVL